MNLQTIQKRVAELTAELLTISNDLESILSGQVERKPVVLQAVGDWADGMKEGDTVICTGFLPDAGPVQRRCFTVGKAYIVNNRLTSTNPTSEYYGIRVKRDNENEGHCAMGVQFMKVGA